MLPRSPSSLRRSGSGIDFDPLIVALAAGMFVRNVTRGGERLRAEIEKVSLPVYVGFFAVTGSTIHIDQLLIVGVPALIFVGVRASGFLAGSWLATTIAKAPDTVRKYAGFGLLASSGDWPSRFGVAFCPDLPRNLEQSALRACVEYCGHQ